MKYSTLIDRRKIALTTAVAIVASFMLYAVDMRKHYTIREVLEVDLDS